MKLIATAALAVAVNAACAENCDMVCDPPEHTCYKSTLNAIGDPNNEYYKKWRQEYPEYNVGDSAYVCIEDSGYVEAVSGKKDPRTQMTSTFELQAPVVAAEGETFEGCGASFTKGLSLAAALALTSYW